MEKPGAHPAPHSEDHAEIGLVRRFSCLAAAPLGGLTTPPGEAPRGDAVESPMRLEDSSSLKSLDREVRPPVLGPAALTPLHAGGALLAVADDNDPPGGHTLSQQVVHR